MTFFEYMQQQKEWDELAFSMKLAIRLFPSLQLENADVRKWRKHFTENRNNEFMLIFEQAVKEFSEVQND